ncbi:beta strand repeat-containing protein [Altererythrobacter sp. C41]|uniref:beta strand repeat-containing protein n=1 Tax=Altererythrobacter sp. C41 TaxID=2806021 RepID=UPI003082AA61
MTVTGTNDAPAAVADSYTVDEDNTLTIAAAAGVLANDSDPDGDALSALLVTGPANGTLTLNPDGSFVYTPDANYSGTDSFTYRANDGTDSGTPVTVNLTVNSVNDAPVANDDSGTASEDSALTVSAATGLLANDTDIDGGALTVGSVNGSAADVGSQVTLASGALLTVNADGSYTYDPNGQFEALRPGQTGTDSFSYTVSDGDLTDTATATITIEGANEAPMAGDDAFTMTGNTPITFTAAQLLGNDSDPDGLASSLSITGVSAGTNGSVVDNGDGTYTFTPTTGYQGAASFSYTVMDADGSTDTGTVDLTVSGQVWYVNSGYDGSNGASDGSYLRPYTQLTQLNGGNGDGSTNDDVDGAGDTIFIADGGGTYTSGITLEEGQTLYGDGQAFTVNGIDIGQSASNSTINASSGVVVTLASDNTISGVNLVGSGTATGLSGTNFGTLTIGNSSIDTVDQAISLTTGTVAGTGLTSTNSDGGGSNISLSGVAGNLDLGTGTLANATVGANLNVSGGTVNVTYDGAITQAQAGSTVLVIGGHSGTLDLNGNITATNGAGLQFNNADGTYNINGSANTLNGGNAGVDILNGSNGTFNFANMTLTHNAAGDAFVVNGTSAIPTNANITFNGSITDNDGNAVVINEHDAGTITFQNGSISSSGVNASGIDVTNSSGGTVNFNGATTLNTGANAAVTLTNNTGATVNFASTGTGLDITTTTGAGFTATGGGTVTLTGAGNTVQTASGRAVEIDNVTIGGAGVTFQSVGVTDGTASTGIVLRNAGSGGFTITGTGSTAGSGGTINSIDSGTDGSATQGSGIYLDNTGNVSLSNMAFTGNFANFGIRGVNVNNFTLRDSTMNGADADDGGFGNSNAADEGAISFDNLTGTALFEGNNLSDGHEDNIRVVNNSGTLNMTVRDSVNNVAVIGRNGTTSGNDGILVTGSGSSDITLLIDGVDFAGSRGDIVQVDASNTATQNVTIRNSTMHNLHQDIVSGGGGISLGLSAGTGAGPSVTYNIENNSIRGAEGNAILVSAIGPAGHMSGTILGNTIGNNDGVHSASQADTGSSAGGNGILARVEKGPGGGTLSHSVRIENNNIGDIASGAGVYLVSNGAGDSSGTARLEAAIRGNTIDELGEFALGGIYAQTGGTGTDDGLLGVDIEDNTINLTGATGALAGIAFDDISPDAQFYFPGYGGPYDDPSLEAFHTGPEGNIIDVTGTFAVPVATLQTGTFANGSAFVLPAPLMVAAGQVPAGLGVTAAQADIDAVREAAIQRWIAAGATEEQIAAMQAVAITVADLPGGYLGQWTAEGIRIDSDGAGFGWYVDPTPEGDGEFAIAEGRLVATADGGAAGKLDLLTVLTHELGHVAGLDDVYDPGSEGELMFGFLAPGSRYLPDAQEASDPRFAPSGQDNAPVADITPLIAQLFDEGFSHFREIDGVSSITPEGGLPDRLDRLGLNMDDLLASVAGSTPPANENSPSEESLPAGAYDWASPSYMPVQDLMENSFADARVL